MIGIELLLFLFFVAVGLGITTILLFITTITALVRRNK